MGNDFAASVQLHTVVAQEVVEMLGRTSSARSPRGDDADTSTAEMWGAGSWRQRALASLFGGDPLAAAADKSSPWASAVGATYPGVTVGYDTAAATPQRIGQRNPTSPTSAST